MQCALVTKEAIKAEKIRQKKLDVQFKKEAAEWTVIRKRAKKAYYKQNNPERVAILEEMKLDLIELTMENDKVKWQQPRNWLSSPNYMHER